MPKVSKRKRSSIPPLEVDLIPVLSCMFLLVPALLLAMEAANWASIPVAPPRHSAQGADDHDPTQPRSLRVHVRADGFALSLDRCESCAPPRVVAREGADGLDALRAAAREVKDAYPSVDSVQLGAEATISLQTLVETMDVLRGEGCSLANSPEGAGSCHFPGVVIDA